MTSPESSVPPVPPAEPVAQPPANPYGQPAQPHYAPQGPYGTGPQAPYGAGQPVPSRGLSIASMVCGIAGLVLSFFLFGFLPALAGVILGHIGMKKEPTAKAFSLTGIITGYAGLALSLITGLILVAAFWFTGTLVSSQYPY